MTKPLPEIAFPERTLQLSSSDKAGECVLYVMSRDQRVVANHALHSAQHYAVKNKLPFAVVFCLSGQKGHRSREHYEFMLCGLKEVETKLAKHNIPFMMLIGDPSTSLKAAIHHLKPKALFFDFSPLKFPRQFQKKIAKESGCNVYVVDTHNCIPVWQASPKLEVGAYTLRPKIHKLISRYLSLPPSAIAHPYSWKGTVMPLQDLEPQIKELLQAIPRSGIHVKAKSGETVARQMLEDFAENSIATYANLRNDLSLDSQSGLSPYLHFGQLSSLQVLVRFNKIAVHAKDELHIFNSPKMPKGDESPDARLNGANALLEEMIIRKELADNFCFYSSSYTTLSGAPAWAQKTLQEHTVDTREFIYTIDELTNAKTHDPAWNAAQTQLKKTGKMHGYMRMYWAKKILEWTPSAEEAISHLIYLNDFYSIDGGDPNGYAGIMWSVVGMHDRPWAERPVFGKVRYMNYGGLKRKFNIQAYEERWRS